MKSKKVRSVVVDAPEFQSEAEEAKWWDKHQIKYRLGFDASRADDTEPILCPTGLATPKY